MIKRCIKCGAKYDSDFKYCPKCGGALEIDPDWLAEQDRKKAEQRRREEEQLASDKRREELKTLFEGVPEYFVLDGKCFRYSNWDSYHHEQKIIDISRELNVSKEEVKRKINKLKNQLNGRESFSLSSFKDDLRKEERLCVDLLTKINREQPSWWKNTGNTWEISNYVKGGKSEVNTSTRKEETGSRTYIDDPSKYLARYKVKIYIIRYYDVKEYSGSISSRCNDLLGYSADKESLLKYFKFKHTFDLLKELFSGSYSVSFEKVKKFCPELAKAKEYRQEKRDGPYEYTCKPGGWGEGNEYY